MRVAFNARLLFNPVINGWNRYLLNLLRELDCLGAEILLYTDRPPHPVHAALLPRSARLVRPASSMGYWWWQQRWAPRQCAADRAELFHTPFNYGLPWSSPCPRVLTLHDAIDRAYYRFRLSWRQKTQPLAMKMRLHHWIARRRAHHIITVSEHAKRDLMRFFGLSADKISVIPLAADTRFQQPLPEQALRPIRDAFRLARPYVFYLGTYEQRKNIPFLIRAFAIAGLRDVDLVLAGGLDREQQSRLEHLARSTGVAGCCRFLGRVDDADLPALYSQAACFVYPSEYEGFGLQLCEAMALGCPTFAARASSLPEVLGAGGETFSLETTEELAVLLRRVTTDGSFRAALSSRARLRAADFSWRKTALRTLDVYRRVLESV